MLANVKKDGDISIITLDDGKANVFSPDMIEAVNKCLDEVSETSGALIIQGREGMFSAGFDLKIFQSEDMELIGKMTVAGFSLLARIFSFPRPVIAACSGHGIALGTFLLCCCDYRIGVKGDYLIGANEMKTNMVIPTPILELIKFRISDNYKYRSILAAEMFSHEGAISANLLDEIVDSNALHERAIEKANELKEVGHPSYKLTKDLFQKESLIKINNAIKEMDPSDSPLIQKNEK